MAKPLRTPTPNEQKTFAQINRMSTEIQHLQDDIEKLARHRAGLVEDLMGDGWSMYGIAQQINVSGTTVRRMIGRTD